jgi:N-acetylglucosaminyl-diphospho-decaprenol L-rhamnosyltransferase
MEGLISISVVSHGQFGMVKNLLTDLGRYCQGTKFELLLTLNLPEQVDLSGYQFPIHLISNSAPKGFGENHNAAFSEARGDYFCVINPDVRLKDNVFPDLVACHISQNAGVSAPIIMSPEGMQEDSARRFPSPLIILSKAIGLSNHVVTDPSEFVNHPDWVAGMFMFFNSNEYQKIGGFDERYFLYYEDVDLCARLRLNGRNAVVCPTTSVIHDAQRTSHRNLKYLRWHITSMLRFFISTNYLRLLWR